ncbi:MAG: SGNH/GDSL hydrolase family protein [Opitutaceae bacterium]|nr:SGNH/GDSL hydrolase family protein [Opitutaceae bacterium]
MNPPALADPKTYLAEFSRLARVDWPQNRTLNVVCHGHSVPSGYFQTPEISTHESYPHLLHVALAKKFNHAVINVIVTAMGGETSERGAARFAVDVLPHRPDVIVIDYALNDRGDGLERARRAWSAMITQAQAARIPVLLLTPTPDQAASLTDPADILVQHAAQVRALAAEFGVGLVDSFAVFGQQVASGVKLAELMSSGNHPNLAGHTLVATEVLQWFP